LQFTAAADSKNEKESVAGPDRVGDRADRFFFDMLGFLKFQLE